MSRKVQAGKQLRLSIWHATLLLKIIVEEQKRKETKNTGEFSYLILFQATIM